MGIGTRPQLGLQTKVGLESREAKRLLPPTYICLSLYFFSFLCFSTSTFAEKNSH